MSNLTLVPAAVALFLALSAALLLGTALAARRLPPFRRGPAGLRAERLFLAVLCPLLAAAAITSFVMATLVDDLLAFHQMPHLCLEGGAFPLLGKLAVFGMEGVAFLALLGVGRQGLRILLLLRRYRHAADTQQQALSAPTAAAVAHVREHLGCRAQFHEADLPRPTAFVLGALRPRCVVARSLVDRLTPAQLEAAIAHEAAHLHRGDHRAKLLLFACGRLFGFLPPVRALLRAWEDASELAADDLAVERTGCRLDLAGALLSAARWAPASAPALVSGSATLLAHRIERLLTPPDAAAESRWQRYLSLLVAGGLAGGLVLLVARSSLLPSLHCLVENLVR